MNNKLTNFLAIVTPAKNEAENVEALVSTVAAQSLVPNLWVFVNDGSSDKTVALFKKAIEKHQSQLMNCEIHVVNYEDPETDYALGQKYSRVVRFGFDKLLAFKYNLNFIGILDCDIQLPTNYYQEIVNLLIEHPALGIASAGSQIEFEDGKTIATTVNRTHAPGGFRVWKRKCFDDTGYVPSVSQDAVSEARAVMMGWKVRSFENIEVTMRKRGAVNGFKYYGKSAYVRRVSQLYVWLGIIRLFLQRRVKDALCYREGYYESKRRNDPRITDELAKKYFRNRLYYRVLGR